MVGTLRRFADQGDVHALFSLAVKYANGDEFLGIKQNEVRSFHLATRGARTGHPSCQWLAGTFLLSGIYDATEGEEECLLTPNLWLAMDYFQKALEGGCPYSAYRLATLYMTGYEDEITPDYHTAFQLFQKVLLKATRSAHDGLRGRTLFRIGTLYTHGLGVAKQLDIAFRCTLLASKLGSDNGFAYVGFMYENGMGVPQNIRQALLYYVKGVGCKSSLAQVCLALLDARLAAATDSSHCAQSAERQLRRLLAVQYRDSDEHWQLVNSQRTAAKEGNLGALRFCSIVYAYGLLGTTYDIKFAMQCARRAAALDSRDVFVVQRNELMKSRVAALRDAGITHDTVGLLTLEYEHALVVDEPDDVAHPNEHHWNLENLADTIRRSTF